MTHPLRVHREPITPQERLLLAETSVLIAFFPEAHSYNNHMELVATAESTLLGGHTDSEVGQVTLPACIREGVEARLLEPAQSYSSPARTRGAPGQLVPTATSTRRPHWHSYQP